ncbi:hypothetical protein R1flu_010559 [Riccia fluitans]|uniref:Uncharacterized protein n=1 Tax=Riccia fluitans TaxID=41844 RepID=A0ABD1Z5C1_9MARC
MPQLRFHPLAAKGSLPPDLLTMPIMRAPLAARVSSPTAEATFVTAVLKAIVLLHAAREGWALAAVAVFQFDCQVP